VGRDFFFLRFFSAATPWWCMRGCAFALADVAVAGKTSVKSVTTAVRRARRRVSR
jgi:hypothetical protein